MIAALLGLVLGGAAMYQETNLVVPFAVGEQLQIRGYAFYQEIRPREPDEPHELFAVGRLEDPYEFTPSKLRVGEIGLKTMHVDTAFYYSAIKIDGVGRFSYAGTRTRIDAPLLHHFSVYAQSAQRLFRTAGDRANLTLGLKWKWIEADWTFGNIDTVQSDDPFFQAAGLHVRISLRF